MKMKRILLILFICIMQHITFAQCTSMPAIPTCIGTTLTDGVNANGGMTYVYTGGISTMTVHFNGADIIVCSGKLTLTSNSDFNGGRLFILAGATVTTEQVNINTNIYNYGILNFTNNVIVNSSGLLMNSGILHISGNLYENMILTNYGDVTINGTLTIMNSGSGACLGNNSKLSVSTIDYGWNINPIKVSSNNACVKVLTTSITGNTSLTSSTGLKICSSGILSINGNGTLGSAVLMQNCTSCGAPLPIDLIYFKGDNINGSILLEWATVSEHNNDFFTILKSYDGIIFNDLINVTGAGNSTTTIYYNYKDYDYSVGINYYKLKQTDYDGKYVDSKIISVVGNTLDYNILIYSIPSSNIKIVVNKTIGISNIKCFNISGELVFSKVITGIEHMVYDLGQYNLPDGVYYITIDNDNMVYIKKIIIKS